LIARVGHFMLGRKVNPLRTTRVLERECIK
jgi:hypothetical protein